MKKSILYLILLLTVACESIYVPELEQAENALVVDAQLIYGNSHHVLKLQKSKGFNDPGGFPPVTTAQVEVQDDQGNKTLGLQNASGNYVINLILYPERSYKLVIKAENEVYESQFEQVPDVPELDSIYMRDFEQWIQPGGETNTSKFIKYPGQQILIDIHDDGQEHYYRFSSRKILQYYTLVEAYMFGNIVMVPRYTWRSFGSSGTYNIAGPPKYSSASGIIQHPVEFFMYNATSLVYPVEGELGWIYIMHQYGLNESAWKYYDKLRSQLDAEGKIFDPLYVQAKGNIKCASDPGKLVLGNFEVCSYRERRYFIRLDIHSGQHILREIQTYHYIPGSGYQDSDPPIFWEH